MDPTSNAERISAREQDARAKPLHHFFSEDTQFRAKVQSFTKSPSEVTVQKIDMTQDQRRYRIAAERGLANVPRPRLPRAEPRSLNPENLERAIRRAKTQCRKTVMELAPNQFVTFTTRGTEGFEDYALLWPMFRRRALEADPGFRYCGVPEPHPSNPSHYHFHAAVRSSLNVKTLRRLWHLSILQYRGLPSNSPTRGADSPGNIDVRRVKGDQSGRFARIARYLTKYITKAFEDHSHFNRKRYWSSKALVVVAASVFWLASLNQVDAIFETLRLLGGAGTTDELLSLRPFMPDTDRVAWFVLDPDKLMPPF